MLRSCASSGVSPSKVAEGVRTGTQHQPDGDGARPIPQPARYSSTQVRTVRDEMFSSLSAAQKTSEHPTKTRDPVSKRDRYSANGGPIAEQNAENWQVQPPYAAPTSEIGHEERANAAVSMDHGGKYRNVTEPSET